MSLQYWFPLTEDLHNQGAASLSNVNVTSATTLATNGKLGGCYTNTGTTANIANAAPFSAEKFSACAWVRINTSRTNWCRAFGMAGTGTYFGLGCEHSNGTLLGFHFYKTIDGTNTAIFDDYPVTKQIGVWVHYTMTYDGIHAYFYENGSLIKTYNVASARQNTKCEMTTLYLFGGTNGNYSQCSLNDVRIYDHCLSAEEVREIANGLVLHYKLDGLNNNLLMDKPAQYNPTSYTAYLLNTVTTLTAGTYRVQLWDVDLYHSAATANQISVKLALGGINGSVMLVAWAGNAFSADGETNYHADYLTASFNLTNNNISQVGEGGWIEIYNSITSSGTRNMHIGAWKLEKGSVASEWVPQNYDATQIIDESGYHHHGTITGTPTISTSYGKYNNSLLFNGAERITSNTLGADIRTLSCWCKTTKNKSTSQQIVSDSFSGMTISFYNGTIIGVFGTVRSTGSKCTLGSSYKENDWNHIVVVKTSDDGKRDIWCNGVKLTPTSDDYWGAATGFFVGARNASNGNAFYGNISDVRAYCTALPDTEILKLYNSGMIMDKNKSIHTHEFNDYSAATTLEKTAILNGQLNETLYCPYDPEVYVEPDGSKWVHIFHQNNASSNLFSSTDTFTSSVYKSANAWFYVSLCNLITSWEFLGVNAEESTSTEKRYRWIQPVNPMNAAFADVAAANITRYTDGYTNTSWGGLYKKNSSTYLCLNNAQSGNWWGAIGAWALSSSGVPALTGTVTKTGYIDLYVRVDNTELTNIALAKNIGWLTNQAIEK